LPDFELNVPGEPLVKRIKKVVLLELRKKHLAMGHAVRRNTDIHFFDPSEMVRERRTKRLLRASKPSCVDHFDWPELVENAQDKSQIEQLVRDFTGRQGRQGS
jgi:hypothetical protein